MATLRDTISADAPSLFVSGDVSAIQPGFRFRLDDELLDLSYFEKYPNIAGRRQKGLDHTHWAVARGVGGSTKATHNAGATLKAAVSALVNSETVTPPIPFAGEGGGAGTPLSFDNTIDPPSDITSLVAAGGTVIGNEATLRGKDFYAQDTDPGAVGVGSVWRDTVTYYFWTRNQTNDGWDANFSPYVVSLGAAVASAGSQATATGDGAAYALTAAQTDGAGLADAGTSALAYGAGDASALTGVLADSGKATTGATATGSSGVAGMVAESDGVSARLGFNAMAATPPAIPELPATPTEQDIADVLVALGLVTQAA